MRLGDYKYLTDYRAHKQWGNDTLWTILNVTLIWSRLDAVIWNRPWSLFGSERDSHWSHTDFLFHASVAYSTLCSVAYTHECSDSTQPNNEIMKCCILLASTELWALWFPSAPTVTVGLARKQGSTLAELWHTLLKVFCTGLKTWGVQAQRLPHYRPCKHS